MLKTEVAAAVVQDVSVEIYNMLDAEFEALPTWETVENKAREMAIVARQMQDFLLRKHASKSTGEAVPLPFAE